MAAAGFNFFGNGTASPDPAAERLSFHRCRKSEKYILISKSVDRVLQLLRPVFTPGGWRPYGPTQHFVSCNVVLKPVTMRFDRDLLEAARGRAAAENRTLTNFVETVVRRQLAMAATPGLDPAQGALPERVASAAKDR